MLNIFLIESTLGLINNFKLNFKYPFGSNIVIKEIMNATAFQIIVAIAAPAIPSLGKPK